MYIDDIEEYLNRYRKETFENGDEYDEYDEYIRESIKNKIYMFRWGEENMIYKIIAKAEYDNIDHLIRILERVECKESILDILRNMKSKIS